MSGLHYPPLGEADTRSKLIDPAIYARGWTEEHIRREVTAGAIETIDDKPRRRSEGRVAPGRWRSFQAASAIRRGIVHKK